MSLLELEGVTVRYPGDITAVRDVSLVVDPGTVALILGPNGAGKTSLLRAITGFLPGEQVKVTARKARYDGAEFLGEPPDHRVARGLVLVPERVKVFETLTTEENLRLAGARAAENASVVEQIDELFPALAERRSSKAGLLSGGEKQMLAIARCLLMRPRLLVIDELSLGIAPRLTAELLATLARLNRETGLTILLVEQSARAALRIADRVYVMRHGEVAWSGPASSLDDKSAFDAVYLSKETTANA